MAVAVEAEATPLLYDSALGSSLSANSRPARTQLVWSYKFRAHFRKWSVLYLCGLAVFFVDFGSFMGEGARLRMLELGICREYYSSTNPHVIGDDGGIPEELCKLDEIQSELARMRGFLGSLENVPGLMLAVPFGILADRCGRKLVASIAVIGIIGRDAFLVAALYFYKTFPLRSVYAAPAFVMIGGGPTVISATVLAMIASSTAEEYRTQSFLYLSVTILFSELLSPPLGSTLMDTIGTYLTFMAGLPFLILGLLVLSFITEDRLKKVNNDESHGDQEVFGESRADLSSDGTKHAFSDIFKSIRQDFSFILKERILILGIFSLAVQKLARPMLDLLLQYMSKRFGWKLGKTVYIISLQAAVQIVLFVWALPKLYQWLLQHSNMDASRANLKLARICIFFLTIGSVLMAWAPAAPIFILAVMIYTCGTGYAHAMRAFLTSFVQNDRITIVYTTMALIEGLISLAASPLLGLTFSAGIKLGGMGIALPFYVAAALYLLAGVGVWSIRSTRGGNVEEDLE